MSFAADRTCTQPVHRIAVVLHSIRAEQSQRPPFAQLLLVLVLTLGLHASAKTRISSASIRCGKATAGVLQRSVQPAFLENARKDKARRTSHANTPRMAQKDRRRAASPPGHTPP